MASSSTPGAPALAGGVPIARPLASTLARRWGIRLTSSRGSSSGGTLPPELVKPASVHDRDAEWNALEEMLSSPRPQLVLALGRRRVGKSYVLSRFAREAGGLYYQATRRTEGEQLAQLSRIAGDHFDDSALRQGVTFPTWEDLLRYVTERSGGRFLLVLDEFPYLTAAAPALPSILQAAWDHLWPETGARIVLAGSYVSAMRRLEDADQPLYGRRTARLLFAPFSFLDSLAFLPGHSPRDQLLAYATFGHLPGQLAHLEPARPVGDSIARALLDPRGPLVDEAQHMLDAFLAESRIHYAILEAVATGSTTWSALTSRIGQSGGSLQRPLRWLEEMGLVARDVPVTERAPLRSKRAVYRVTDPYLVFWHRHVAPLLQTGTIGLVEPARLLDEIVLPRIGEHLGAVFEEVSREFVRRSSRLPLRPVRVGRWWDARSTAELDVVAYDAEGRLFAGECKWGSVDSRDLAALRSRADLAARELGGVREVSLALFTGRTDPELDPTVLSAVEAGEVLLFTLDDLAASEAGADADAQAGRRR